MGAGEERVGSRLTERKCRNFHARGEKRYWLHIALARDLNTDRTVDVLGAQLEEVTE
jgi:hypothetical protein